jgi:hypothetical protein
MEGFFVGCGFCHHVITPTIRLQEVADEIKTGGNIWRLN